MAASLSIDAYIRKQNARVVKTQKRFVGASSCRRRNKTYTSDQQRYLNACVEKQMDPDERLLLALREARFMLKLDRFGKEELAFNMGYLRKTKTCQQISLSLGSMTRNRDLRNKFDRLGLKHAYACEHEGASIAVRSACISAYKTTNLVCFHLIGVKILPDVLPLLAKAVCQCSHLEDISLNGTNLGDEGLKAIAIPLGKCARLRLVSLAGCRLTDKARDHVTKIVSLHGVIKDEAVWSSSLREEVTSVISIPELMIDLSRNDFGDETAEAICDVLYNDKWLLGLNLGANHISQLGIERFLDTLSNNNHTLAVLSVANMKNPVGMTSLNILGTLLHGRDRFLQQQVATESRYKRMQLGALLLEWGVDKDKVVEICYLESQAKEIRAKSISRTRMVSNNDALNSPKDENDLTCPQSTFGNNGDNATCQFNDSRSNNNAEDTNDENENKVNADSQNNTIKYLIERLSALEAEKRKTHEYVKKIETENRELRAKLEADPKSKELSPIEAQIITQLETSISSLAEQVEFMELEKQQNSSRESITN